MPSSLHTARYEVFRRLLVQARADAGLTQVDVAARLRKPQSYISKIERGERRLDMTEFVDLADALGIEMPAFIDAYRSKLRKRG